MKIVVLDGYAADPGDISWDGIAGLGDLTVHDRTPADLIIERSEGAEVLLTNKTPITAETISRLPDLKYIGVLATGYNVVDLQAAKEQGIVVTNVPAYSTASVAELVFAFLLELCRHVQVHTDVVRAGGWATSIDFAFWKTPQIELAGKTMGIIGFGQIGRQVGRIASALDMRILAASTRRLNAPDYPFEWADIPDILSRSDVVTIHAPLTPETQGLINRDALARMKPTAFLINTSRGPVVVEQDLADALNDGTIAGAGLDVLSKEPPNADNPLFTAKNCLFTPHIGWATSEARLRLMHVAAANLRRWMAGTPVNVV
jgi:glycerate dehydrogenase